MTASRGASVGYRTAVEMSTRIVLLVLLVGISGILANRAERGEEVRRTPGGSAGWRRFMHRKEGGAMNHHNGHYMKYTCPNGGFVRLGNGCYHFSTTMANWQEAHFECNDLHPSANLANLETAWEDKNIRTHLNRPESARLERWIGGIYDWRRGAWVWGRTGQPFSYQGFSRRSVSRPQWECSYMDPIRRYRWIHGSCLSRRHYICEAPLSRVAPLPNEDHRRPS